MGRFVINAQGQEVYVPSSFQDMSAHLQDQGHNVAPNAPNFFDPTLSDLVSPISGAGAGVPDIEVQQPVIYDEEKMQFENLLLNEEQNERLRQSEREKHKWKEEQEKKVRETKEYKEWERAHTVWMQRVRGYRSKLEKWKADGGSEEGFVQKFGPEPRSRDEVPERPRIAWQKEPQGFMEIDPRGGAWGQRNQHLGEQQQAQADAAETQEQQIRRQRSEERKRFKKERRDAILNSPDAIKLVDGLLDSHGNILPGPYSPEKLPELNNEPLYEGFKNWYTQNPLVKGAAWDDRIEGDAFTELIRRRVDQRTRLDVLQTSLDKEWERSGAKASGRPRPDARQYLERQRLQAQQTHEEKERRLQERHEQRRQDALIDPNTLAAGAEEMLGFDPTSASLMGLAQMGAEDPGERTPREFKWDTGDERDVILPHMKKTSDEDWGDAEEKKVDRPRQVESLRPGHREFNPDHSGRPPEDWSEELPLSESLTLDLLGWGQTTANAISETWQALVPLGMLMPEGPEKLPFPGPSLKEQYIKEHAENRRKWFEHQSKNPVVQSRQLVWEYIYQKKPIVFQDGSSVNLWELPEEQKRQFLKSLLKQHHPDLDDGKIEVLIDRAYKASAAAQVEVNTFQIDLKAAEENLRRNDLYQGQEWTTTESLLDNARKSEVLGKLIWQGPYRHYIPHLVPETERRKVSNKAADQNKKITESYEDLKDYLEQRGFWGELEKVEGTYENFRIETGWQQAKAQHIGHLYDSLKKENASESEIFRVIGEANKLSKKEYLLATQKLQAQRSKDLAWYYSDILNLPESSNLTKLALWSLTVGEEAVGMIGTGVFGVGAAIGVPGFETTGLRWKALLDNRNLAVNELEKSHLSPNIAKMSAPTRNALSFLVAAGITGQFAPWMSSMGGVTALAGATSFGDGYLELRKEGGSQENSVAYGLLLAAAEVAPMMLGARLGKVIPGAEGILRHFKPGGVLAAKGPVASVTRSAARQAFKSITLAPAAIVSEVWQESLTAIGESIAAGYFVDRKRMSKGAIAEAVSQAIVGAVVGAGFGETISATGATINQFEFNRKIKNQAIKELTDFGKTSFEINQALMMSNREGVLAFVDSPTRTRLAKILPGAKLSGPMRQRLADSLRPMANSLREFRGTLRWHAVTVVHNGETSVIRVQAATQREAEQRARVQIKGVGIVSSINLEGFGEKDTAQPTPETEAPTAKEEPQYDRFGFDKDGFDKDGVTEYGKIKDPTWPGKPIALNIRQAEARLKAISERTIPREYPIDVDKVKETLKKAIEIAKRRITALGGDVTGAPTEPTPQPTPTEAPQYDEDGVTEDGRIRDFDYLESEANAPSISIEAAEQEVEGLIQILRERPWSAPAGTRDKIARLEKQIRIAKQRAPAEPTPTPGEVSGIDDYGGTRDTTVLEGTPPREGGDVYNSLEVTGVRPKLKRDASGNPVETTRKDNSWRVIVWWEPNAKTKSETAVEFDNEADARAAAEAVRGLPRKEQVEKLRAMKAGKIPIPTTPTKGDPKLGDMNVSELKGIAKELGIKGAGKMQKESLIPAIENATQISEDSAAIPDSFVKKGGEGHEALRQRVIDGDLDGKQPSEVSEKKALSFLFHFMGGTSPKNAADFYKSVGIETDVTTKEETFARPPGSVPPTVKHTSITGVKVKSGQIDKIRGVVSDMIDNDVAHIIAMAKDTGGTWIREAADLAIAQNEGSELTAAQKNLLTAAIKIRPQAFFQSALDSRKKQRDLKKAEKENQLKRRAEFTETREQLEARTKNELKDIARELGVKTVGNKPGIIDRILDAVSKADSEPSPQPTPEAPKYDEQNFDKDGVSEDGLILEEEFNGTLTIERAGKLLAALQEIQRDHEQTIAEGDIALSKDQSGYIAKLKKQIAIAKQRQGKTTTGTAPTESPTPTEAAKGASVPADPSTFEVGPGARKDASRPVFKPRTMTPEQQKKLYNFSKQPGAKLKDIVKKYDEIMETTPEEKQARRQHAFVLYGESEAGNWAGGIDKGTTVGTITKDGALNERHGSGRTNVAFSASDPDVKVADKIGKDKAQKEKALETLYPGAKFKEGIATGFRNQGIVGPPTRKPATPKPTAGEKAEQREIKAAQKKRAEQKKEREDDRVWKDLRKRSPKGTKQTVSIPIEIGGKSQNVKVDALVLDDTWAITRGIVDIDGKPVLVDRKRMTDAQWKEHKDSQWNLTHLSSGLSAATASQVNLRQLYQMIQDSGVKVPKSWAELSKDGAATKTLKELRSAWDASDLSLLPDNLRQKFLDSVKVPDPGVTADMVLDSGDLVKTKGLKVIKELVKEVPEIAYNPIFIVDENKKLVFRDHYTYRLSPGIFNLSAGELSVGQSIGINLPDLGIKKITDKNEVIKKVLKAQGYKVSQGEARKQEIIDGIQWDQKKTQSDIIAKAKLSPAKTQTSGKPSREATPPMRTAPDEAESAPLQSRPQTTPVSRIPVDPLPLPEGKTPEAPADIIFSAKLGRQPIKGKLPKQTLGTYSPATGRIVIKYGNDLDTAAHELGHFVDDAASIGADLLVVQKYPSKITNADGTTQQVEIEVTEYTDEAKAMLDEMMGFAQHGSIEETGPRSEHRYVAGEAIAEWIRAYLVNPDATLKQAPVFSKFMLSRLQKRAPKALKKLREFGDKIRVHGGLSGINKTISNVKFEGFGGDGESLITLGLNNVAAFTQEIMTRIWRDTGHAFNPGFYSKLQSWFGDSLDPAMHGIDVLKARHGDFINPLKDPEILIRNLQGKMTQWEDQLLHGPIDWKAWLAGDGVVRPGSASGVGNLQYLFAPLDMTSADTLKRDVRLLHAFMIAERHIERSEVIDEKAFFKLLEEIGLIIAELESTVKARKEDGLDIPQELKEELNLYMKAVALAEGEINSIKYGDGKYFAGLETIWINLGDLPIGKKTERIIKANNKQRQHMIGSGAGLEGDLRVSKRTLAEINALPPEDVSRLRDAAERYRAFADAMILQPLLHFGRISREQYNEIKADNQFYVNMRRIVDSNNLITADPTKAMGSTGVTTTKSVIKKFFGSTEPIGNIYANMLQIGQIAQHDAQRNYALQQMAELAESKPRRMYEGPALNLAEIMHRVEKEDSNAVKIYINGKETYWRMHPEIRKALDGIGNNASLPVLFTILPRILRNTITYFPAFMFRNIIRDTFTRPHLTNVGSQLRHTFQALGKTAEASEFMLGGGGQFGHYLKSRVDYVAHMHRATRELIKDKNVTVMTREQISKGWEKYKSLAEGSEKLNRLAEFRVAKKKALDAGLSESDAILYAAYEARDLLDFAVSGSVMKYVNQMVPFTNAAVQALRRAVKQLHRNPNGLLVAWLKYSVVPELMVYAWNMTGSEEERDEYRQLPAWRKDFYYNIRLGPNTWLAIPKPYEFGVLASGVTRAIDVISGGATRKQGFEGFRTSFLKSFSPVDIKAIAGPFVSFLEVRMNYDLFKGKPTIPPYEKKQDVRIRKGTERGSNVGKFLQTFSLQAVDARNWDHLLVGLFGSTGRAVVEVSDLGEPGSLNNWGRSIGLLIGITRDGGGTSARDVVFITEWAVKNGHDRKKSYKEFKKLFEEYYTATNNKERQRIARHILAKARGVRKKIESGSPGDDPFSAYRVYLKPD